MTADEKADLRVVARPANRIVADFLFISRDLVTQVGQFQTGIGTWRQRAVTRLSYYVGEASFRDEAGVSQTFKVIVKLLIQAFQVRKQPRLFVGGKASAPVEDARD